MLRAPRTTRRFRRLDELAIEGDESLATSRSRQEQRVGEIHFRFGKVE
ncbi:hypothetical protein JQ554_18070 [Bradyrhizobium diazoefficiens]|nr:hypothetical protein [Bradyrhizobium diazoefficiens]MBR0966116.1 hypothetical protein [Bradyrhizobium diazoefficiens]MBR0979586.1 hypothetical protein [Bradyrhizobium diazoefficiens]MBR1008934.1 hypothetical protein [Bradyrhizobium diazoefficiens]MBR1015382.1 hypothetical protein [Bradyrhizobium diazoefficiens]MBR1053054.1 hypothetical protein [Bradyrhizobium diazoefficiens]